MSVLKGAGRFLFKGPEVMGGGKNPGIHKQLIKILLHAPKQRYVQPLTETEML